MDLSIVRENAARGYGRAPLSPSHRGYYIGRVESELRSAASRIGLGVSFRAARLALASQVFERKIGTFSSLSDDELTALEMWTRTGDVDGWLAKKYGFMEKLL